MAEAESDAGEEPVGDEDAWQYPPFMLLLDPPPHDDELRALIERPEGVRVPGYLAAPSADGDCKTFGVTPDHGRCIDDQQQHDRGRVRRAV